MKVAFCLLALFLIVSIFMWPQNSIEEPFLEEQELAKNPSEGDDTNLTVKQYVFQLPADNTLLSTQDMVLENIEEGQMEVRETDFSRSKAKSGKYNDKISVRQKFVEFPDEFYNLEVGNEYQLKLFDDAVVTFTVKSQKNLGRDSRYLQSEIKGVKYGYVSLIFKKSKHVGGNVTIPGKRPINIMSIGDGVHRISERKVAKRKISPVYEYAVKNRHKKEGDKNE